MESFEIKDIEEIAKEVFGDIEYTVSYKNKFEAGVFINVKEVSDEQISNLENKLIDKYQFEKEDEDIVKVIDMPSVDIYDLIKLYIEPVIITAVVTILFLTIVFRKLGIVKALIVPICLIIGITGIYISGVAILRIPVSEYIIGVGVFVYTMSLVIATLYGKYMKSNAINSNK